METISSIPLFSMLPIGALSKINDKLVAEIYPAKRKIIEKGDEADCMYIIEFGSVQVEIESPVTLGQGDYFGEKGILSQRDSWFVQFYGQNITDNESIYYRNLESTAVGNYQRIMARERARYGVRAGWNF